MSVKRELTVHVTLCLALTINSYSVLIIIASTFLQILLVMGPPLYMVPQATLAVCRAKAAPSFLSYFKTLSIGSVPGIKPTTSHSAVKHYALPTERILLQLTSRIFNIVSYTCYYLASP